MSESRPWSKAEDDLVLSLLPSKEIAARTNRTVAAVDQHRAHLRQPEAGYAANKSWRQANPDKRNEAKQRNYERGAQHQHNARQPWTQQEDRAILAPDRPTDRELARQLGRTVQAIQIRRSRL